MAVVPGSKFVKQDTVAPSLSQVEDTERPVMAEFGHNSDRECLKYSL